LRPTATFCARLPPLPGPLLGLLRSVPRPLALCCAPRLDAPGELAIAVFRVSTPAGGDLLAVGLWTIV